MALSSDAAGDEGRVELDALFRCLADGDRRRLLGAVVDQAPEVTTLRDLAAALTRPPESSQRTGEPDDRVRRAMVGLHHEQLPTLEAAGLVEHDRDRGTVTAADHPALRDEGILAVVRGEVEADAGSLDAFFRALADGRRRTALDVLGHQFGPIHAETLARELGARERDTAGSAVPGEVVERLLSSLHHRHLPRLSASGLVEYDAEDELVEYAGHPELRVPWLHSVLESDFRASLTGEPVTREVGSIEGREPVVSFGQALCDKVDEELFCLFTDTGMLESGYFTRIKDASRRGVDIYLGTRDPAVREFVCERAPAVTIWEPDADWLDLPVGGRTLGCVVLADREAVVIGTRGAAGGDGTHEERAIVGEGADNALVVMMSQMATPHIDGSDERAGVVESHLPF